MALWCELDIGNNHPDFFSRQEGQSRVGTRHKNPEFFAANPTENQVVIGLALNGLANELQGFIALFVANRIIDFLEMINVDQHHGDRIAASVAELLKFLVDF
jgi:hypothetical protein